MAFAKKGKQSYGVPVRTTVPAQRETVDHNQVQLAAAGSQSWSCAPPAAAAPAADFFAPPGSRAAGPVGYTQGGQEFSPYAQQFSPYAQRPLPTGPTGGTSNTITKITIGLASATVIAVLAVVVVPAFLRARGPVKPPGTLAGRSRMDDPVLKKQLEPLTSQWRVGNSGKPAAIALYQEGNGRPSIVLVAARGRFDELEDLDASAAAMSIDVNSKQQFGSITCYDSQSQPFALCVWSDDVSGILVSLTGGTLADAAAIAAEAKNALS